tara:strand:+ start:169 stop:720 length:552 start_codon:yes stop_codon:yes gene_type:complete
MWKLILLFVVLIAFGFESIYLRGKGAERQAIGAVASVDKVVGLHVTDKHLLNEEVVRDFAKKAPVIIFNYRPGRAQIHADRDEVKSVFIDSATHAKFKKSFVGWSLAEFDVNDISIKEGNVYRSKVTRSFSVGVGKKMWYSKARLVVMNRALGKSIVEYHEVDIVLAFRDPKEGLGVYKLDVY